MSKKKTEETLPACEFTIDPADPCFKDLRGVCEIGNPYRCLLATMASIKVRKRLTVRLNHETWEGVIGLSHNGMRYERPMTAEEVQFARKFDLGSRLRNPLVVRIDIMDGTWKARPSDRGRSYEEQREATGRRPTRTGDGVRKTIRKRQLMTIKRTHGTAS